MSQAERRYDRLAVRLSLIISRLFAGETLNMRKLAMEFGVSERTLYRDFRERLIYLDLEYQNGCCRLLSGGRQEIQAGAAMQFARQSGTDALFPEMDHHLVSSLLSSQGSPPCLFWHQEVSVPPSRPGIFTRLVRAVSEQRRITLLTDECRCDSLAPYRLIFSTGAWFLAGEYLGRITVFALHAVHSVTFHPETFIPDGHLTRILSRPDFLQALPHFHVFHSLFVDSNGQITHKEQV
ncbi:helix-turn-helix transcriptional regulator [Escherichia coli]|uniref:helix-turn-helix transcriptional regulator n=1 Tax=Escherichia coli TaxID=562 RepID=UPI001B93CB0F|nr:transcriptional regulator [Escherichia coli]EKG9464447.1 transcriptional regulator [Escherichia coli]HBC9586854.1 transcriptional regulator [Escherichia coli]HDP8010477.1 transcriptional regulator [Escherichia coli]